MLYPIFWGIFSLVSIIAFCSSGFSSLPMVIGSIAFMLYALFGFIFYKKDFVLQEDLFSAVFKDSFLSTAQQNHP
jgi:hypothetical protein